MDTVQLSVENFFSHFRLVHYKAGEQLFSALDTPPGIFYLKKGFVKQYSISVSGSELTIHIFGPGTHFPMSWALNDTPNRHDFQAITESEIFIAPKPTVVELFKSDPLVAYEFAKRAVAGLDGLTRRIETIAFGSGYHRVVSILLYLATHFGQIKETKTTLTHRFTHQDIASLAGMSREHISLELEKLEKFGYIRYENHCILIPNVDELAQQLLASYKK